MRSFNFWLNKFYSKVLIIFLCLDFATHFDKSWKWSAYSQILNFFFLSFLELSRNLMFQETIVDRLNFPVWNWYFLPLGWVLFLISTKHFMKTGNKMEMGYPAFQSISRWHNSSKKLAKWIFRLHNSLTI